MAVKKNGKASKSKLTVATAKRIVAQAKAELAKKKAERPAEYAAEVEHVRKTRLGKFGAPYRAPGVSVTQSLRKES